MLAPYTGESLYSSLNYLFTILRCLPSLGMAPLWEELTSRPLDLGFDRMTDCDYWKGYRWEGEWDNCEQSLQNALSLPS